MNTKGGILHKALSLEPLAHRLSWVMQDSLLIKFILYSIELEGFVLREINHTQKNTSCSHMGALKVLHGIRYRRLGRAEGDGMNLGTKYR